DRAFRRTVVEQVLGPGVHRLRGAVDDRRSFPEMGGGGLRQVEHPEDVGLEGPLELLFGNVLDLLVRMLLPGIVDEDVEAAELVHHLLHGFLAEILVADVAGNRDRLAPFLLDDLLRELGVVVLAEVEDGDVGPLAGEEGGDGAADAAVSTGDQRHLVLQSSRAAVARFPIRLRLQLAFVSGKPILVDHRFHDIGHWVYSFGATPIPSRSNSWTVASLATGLGGFLTRLALVLVRELDAFATGRSFFNAENRLAH